MSIQPPDPQVQPPADWYRKLFDASVSWLAVQILPVFRGFRAAAPTIVRYPEDGRILLVIELIPAPNHPAVTDQVVS